MRFFAKTPSDRPYAWLLISGGIIGLMSSFVITLEKFKLLMDAGYTPACSINPIISCGSVMKSAQASAFGFPNSWLGLVGFAAVIVVGVGLLAGAHNLKIWYWRVFHLGTIFGVLFIHWLMFQSLYVIGALCPWCMVVWAVTIPIFWYTTTRLGHLGIWPRPRRLEPALKTICSYKNVILVVWYLIIIGLITQHFWYYWRTLL